MFSARSFTSVRKEEKQSLETGQRDRPVKRLLTISKTEYIIVQT
jgi:hypothetical protein